MIYVPVSILLVAAVVIGLAVVIYIAPDLWRSARIKHLKMDMEIYKTLIDSGHMKAGDPDAKRILDSIERRVRAEYKLKGVDKL